MHSALPRASLPLKGNQFFMGTEMAPGSCEPCGDGRQLSQQLSPSSGLPAAVYLTASCSQSVLRAY